MSPESSTMKTPTPEQLRLAAEIIETGCEWEVRNTSLSLGRFGFFAPTAGNDISFYLTDDGDWEIRKKPQPQPDKWAVEKAAFKAGKVIQWKPTDPTFSDWADTDGPEWFTDGAVEYRVKPWQLTNHLPGFRPLTPGEQWHRNDFTEDMLPEGWRPLLRWEVIVWGEGNDEYSLNHNDEFHWQIRARGTRVNDPDYGFWRTRRPLPPLKSERRIPFRPGDVPPGSAIRGAGESKDPDFKGWCLITSCGNDGIRTWRGCDDNQEVWTWEELKSSWSQPPPPRINHMGTLFKTSTMKSPSLCTVRFCRNPRHQKRTICAKHVMQEWRTRNPVTELLNTIRNRARRRNIEFSLTIEEFKQFTLTSGYQPRLHHIDRIDPTQGYHIWNIQVLGCSENIAKGNRERHSERYQEYLAKRKLEMACPF